MHFFVRLTSNGVHAIIMDGLAMCTIPIHGRRRLGQAFDHRSPWKLPTATTVCESRSQVRNGLRTCIALPCLGENTQHDNLLAFNNLSCNNLHNNLSREPCETKQERTHPVKHTINPGLKPFPPCIGANVTANLRITAAVRCVPYVLFRRHKNLPHCQRGLA